MWHGPSLTKRIAIGKTIGLVVGLVAFVVVPYLMPEMSGRFRWGMLLWYTTMGAFIGLMGVYDHHPILKFPIPWWFRGIMLGGWMNFVLTLFAYEELAIYMTNFFGDGTFLSAPYWLVVEGMLVGFVMSFLTTRFGGEGKATTEEL